MAEDSQSAERTRRRAASSATCPTRGPERAAPGAARARPGQAADAPPKPKPQAEPRRPPLRAAKAAASAGRTAAPERARRRRRRGQRRARGPRLGRRRRRGRGRDARRPHREPGARGPAGKLGARLTEPAAGARMAAVTQAGRTGRTWLRAFWERAYRENVTGMAAMVAFNLALAVFPFALLILFIFGQVIESADVRGRACSATSQGLFPAVRGGRAEPRARPDPGQLDHDRGRRRARCDLDRRLVLGGDGHRLLPHLPRRVPRLGRAEALRASLMLHRRHPLPRRERRHPARRERWRSRAPRTCRSGSIEVRGIAQPSLVLAAALTITFGIVSLIYYVVPKGHVPWRGVWPGALFVTATTAIANAVFPFYLDRGLRPRPRSAARSASSSSRCSGSTSSAWR